MVLEAGTESSSNHSEDFTKQRLMCYVEQAEPTSLNNAVMSTVDALTAMSLQHDDFSDQKNVVAATSSRSNINNNGYNSLPKAHLAAAQRLTTAYPVPFQQQQVPFQHQYQLHQQNAMILSELYHQPIQMTPTYGVLTATPSSFQPATFHSSTARSPGRAQYRTVVPDRAIQYGSYVEPGSLPTLNGNMNGHESNNNSHRASPRDERLSQTNLYIRKLKDEDSDDTIRQLLIEAGVQPQTITTTKAVRDESGTCRSYGFADFNSHEAALVAKEKLKHIRNGELEVSFAKEAEKDPTNVYIRNIPEDDTQYNEQWLARIFSQYGTVVSSRVLRTNHRDPMHNITIQKPTGTGFVRFEKESEALACIEGINARKQDIILPPGAALLDAKLADKGSKKRSHAGGLTNSVLHNSVCSMASQLPGGYGQVANTHQLLGYGAAAGTSLLAAAGYANGNRVANHSAAGQLAAMYIPSVAGPALYQTSGATLANGAQVNQSVANYMQLQNVAAATHQHHPSSAAAAAAAAQLVAVNQQSAQVQATQQMLQQLGNTYPSYAFIPSNMTAPYGCNSAGPAGVNEHAYFYPDLSNHAVTYSATAMQAATE